MPSAEHNVFRKIEWLLLVARREFPECLAARRRRECPQFFRLKEIEMSILRQILFDDSGQDIAEYAVMLAVILVLVVGTIRLVGSNANNAFSNVASTLQ
jgi:Flp pilus assembly pilin Flp